MYLKDDQLGITQVETLNCNDFKQFISLHCHVVVMLVVGFTELWTSRVKTSGM